MFQYQQTFQQKQNERKTIPLSVTNTQESYQHAVETSSRTLSNSSQPNGIVPDVDSSYQRRSERDLKRKSPSNDSAQKEMKKQKRVQEKQFVERSEFGEFKTNTVTI